MAGKGGRASVSFVGLLCSLLCAGQASAQDDVVFVTPFRDYSVGSPRSAASADFNGDEIPDLAIASESSNTVLVLTGNGDGSFRNTRSFPTGRNPRWVVAADFKGDGILDLATANAGTNDVSILLGNGDGTFLAPQNFLVGREPSFIAVGDFNNDQVPDLAVANAGSNDVTILLGTGDGAFLLGSSFLVGSAPRSIAVADFSGGGFLDLAVANTGTNTLTILLGTGDGQFRLGPDVTVPSNPTSVTTGDFNEDGIPDLAVARGPSFVSVFLGNGDGTFQAPTHVLVGSNPSFVAVGDFNRDSHQDLFVTNSASNNVSLALGVGDGSFRPAQSFGVENSPVSAVVADFNLDGWPDAAVANFTSNSVSIMINDRRLVVTTPRLPASRLGDTYSAQLRARGGTPPYTWSLASGELPPGLSLDGSTGVISGMSTSEGDFEFTVEVQDDAADTASAPLRISIRDCPTIADLESCQEINEVCPNSKSDVYELETQAGERYEAYCDMDTDGGGWTLVLAYAHQGGTNSPLQTGVRPVNPDQGFSHFSSLQMRRIPFTEARFYCQISAHTRRIHFATSNTGAIDYIRTGGANQATFWNTGFRQLPGHSANLPASADNAFSNQGDLAMTEFPFYRFSVNHWGVRGNNTRWECDDFNNGFQYTTLHQVWVR